MEDDGKIVTIGPHNHLFSLKPFLCYLSKRFHLPLFCGRARIAYPALDLNANAIHFTLRPGLHGRIHVCEATVIFHGVNSLCFTGNRGVPPPKEKFVSRPKQQLRFCCRAEAAAMRDAMRRAIVIFLAALLQVAIARLCEPASSCSLCSSFSEAPFKVWCSNADGVRSSDAPLAGCCAFSPAKQNSTRCCTRRRLRVQRRRRHQVLQDQAYLWNMHLRHPPPPRPCLGLVLSASSCSSPSSSARISLCCPPFACSPPARFAAVPSSQHLRKHASAQSLRCQRRRRVLPRRSSSAARQSLRAQHLRCNRLQCRQALITSASAMPQLPLN
jgi:hypothetical protein